jgi:RNA polymerase sigma factor (sigma-70 family)
MEVDHRTNITKEMGAAPQVPDAGIIERVINGDTALFELLIRRYNPFLYKVGRSYGYCHQDVEDLMQESFIHAFQHLGQLKNGAHFKTWLVRIMLNECYRKQHKFSFRKEVVVDPLLNEKSIPMFTTNDYGDAEKNMGNKELRAAIENAIKNIPIDYRMVFSLRELNGMSVQETSTALNISETNVKVRLNRAKAMLRKEVEKMYSPEEIFEFNLIYCDAIVARVMKGICDL